MNTGFVEKFYFYKLSFFFTFGTCYNCGMEVYGIIMEINPFHNGHLYFLEQARIIANDKPLVCVISTNVVQRGEISVLNKDIKTKLLLENGVDIVCELPTVLANQGGQYFGLNALKILSQFKVNNLIFGSETADLSTLVTQSLEFEASSFNVGINANLEQLKSNDILGISYLKAARQLGLELNYHLIKRISNNYNDHMIESKIASATSIRNNLENIEAIKHTLPSESLANIRNIDKQLLFNLFKVNLANAIDNNHNIFLAEDNQLLYRIDQMIAKHNPTNLDQLLEYCKDKNNSKYKYSRIVINTVLQITTDNYEASSYLRVLGFNTRASKLLPTGCFTSLATRNDKLSLIEKRSAKLFSLLTSDFQYDEFNRKPLIYKENNGF